VTLGRRLLEFGPVTAQNGLLQSAMRRTTVHDLESPVMAASPCVAGIPWSTRVGRGARSRLCATDLDATLETVPFLDLRAAVAAKENAA
jgi:hypothetical protein